MKLTILLLLSAVTFFVLRRLQQPKAKTQRLVITVWAAFGPHDTAKDAEDILRRACIAVFGMEGASAHEGWIQEHTQNFCEAEKRGSFLRLQRFMRAWLLLTAYGQPFQEACRALKVQAAVDGEAALNALAEHFPQLGGYREMLHRSLQPGQSLSGSTTDLDGDSTPNPRSESETRGK